jgi:hypothetical protein
MFASADGVPLSKDFPETVVRCSEAHHLLFDE